MFRPLNIFSFLFIIVHFAFGSAALVAQDLKLLRELGSKNMGTINNEVFSPNNQYIATSYQDGVLRLWDIQKGELYRTFKVGENRISEISFSPNSELMATADDLGKIKIWSIASGKQIVAYTIPQTNDFLPRGEHPFAEIGRAHV